MINELPPNMRGHKETAAPIHLFKIDQNNPTRLLNGENADLFQLIMIAQAFWLSRRGRPDLQQGTVVFLFIRCEEAT